MGDTRKDFSEFYPGGRVPLPSVPTGIEDIGARARLDALASAVGALADLDPDGPESVAEVKERVNAVAGAVAAV